VPEDLRNKINSFESEYGCLKRVAEVADKPTHFTD